MQRIFGSRLTDFEVTDPSLSLAPPLPPAGVASIPFEEALFSVSLIVFDDWEPIFFLYCIDQSAKYQNSSR